MKKQPSGLHRFLAGLCAAAMLFGIAPTSALAQGPEEPASTCSVSIAAEGLSADRTLEWDTDNTQPVQLTATVSETLTDAEYTWQSDNAAITVVGNGDTATLQTGEKYDVTGTVTVTVTGTDAAQKQVNVSDHITVKLTGTPELKVWITTDESAPAKVNDTLHANVTLDEQTPAEGVCSYQWFCGGEELPGQTGPDCTAEKTGKYTVKVTALGDDVSGRKAASAVSEAVTVLGADSSVDVTVQSVGYGTMVTASVTAEVPGTIEFTDLSIKADVTEQPDGKCTASVELGRLDAVENGTLNYTFTPSDLQTYAPTTGNRSYTVSPKEITASSFTLENTQKTYDGNTNFSVAEVELQDWVEGDVVQADPSAFEAHTASANVGEGLSAKLSVKEGVEPVLTGADAGNYKFVIGETAPEVSVSIQPKEVKLTGVTFTSKTYDGTTTIDSSLVQEVALEGVVPGEEEQVSLNDAKYEAVSADVGNQAVTIDLSAAKLTGDKAGNYTLNTTDVPQNAVIEIEAKDLTLQVPGVLQIKKKSDGTTALTEANKEILNKQVTLKGVVESDKEAVGLEIVYDGAEYSSPSIFGEDNTITGLQFNLTGGKAGNYTLKLDGEFTVPACILANETSEEVYDLSADNTIALEEGVVAQFSAGQNLSNPEGALWYKGEPALESENMVLLDKNGKAYSFDSEQGENKVTELYLWVGEENTGKYDENTGKYYGPFTLTYQFDNIAPQINTTAVKEIGFGSSKKNLEYTFKVIDQGSGVGLAGKPDTLAENQIQYYVGDKTGLENIAEEKWVNASAEKKGDSYTFTITVPNAGYLYLRACDNAGNQAKADAQRAFVLEDDKPSLKLSCEDAADPLNGHRVTFEATDKKTESKAIYSGIQKIAYQLIQVGENGEETVVKQNSWTYDAPDSIDGLKEAEDEMLDLSEGDGKKYNGKYILKAIARDFCGNESAPVEMELHFDNAAPEVKIEMATPAEKDKDGNYYYRADNGGVIVSISDQYVDRVQAKVTLKSENGGTIDSSKKTPEKDEGRITFTFDAEDVAELADGVITVSVTASDFAGNKTEQFSEATGLNAQETTEEGVLQAGFVLDTTAPVLRSVAATEGKNYREAVYHNGAFDVTFTVDEVNYDPEKAVPDVAKQGDAEEKDNVTYTKQDVAEDETGKQHTVQVKVGEVDTKQTTYDISLKVADKAGNLLVKDDAVSDNTNDANSVTVESGTAQLKQRVLDTTAPVLRSVAATEGKNYREAVYHNGAFDVTFTVDEVNYDPEKAVPDVAKQGDAEEKDNVTYTKQDVAEDETGEQHTVQVKVGEVATKKTAYDISLNVEDKAGNLLVKDDAVSGDIEGTPNSVTVESGTARLKQRVLDTTAPKLTEATLTAGNLYPDESENKIYYSAGFTAKYAIEEVNYDDNKVISQANVVGGGEQAVLNAENQAEITLTVAYQEKIENALYTFGLEMQDKAGNKLANGTISTDSKQDSVTVKDGVLTHARTLVLDTVAPVLRSVVATEGNNYPEAVYHNGAFDVTFTVDEVNYDAGLDESKGYSVLTVKKDGKGSAKVSKSDESDKQHTVQVNVAKVDTEKTTYDISLKVADKAGNLLVKDDAVSDDIEGTPNSVTVESGTARLKQRVMDTVAPRYTLDLAAPSNEFSVYDNRAYYDKDIVGTFVVEDATLDSQLIKAGVAAAADTAAKYDEAQVDWNSDIQPGEPNETGDQAGISVWKYILAIQQDGVYRFQIEAADRAGNQLVKSAAEEGKDGTFEATSGGNGRFRSEIKVHDTVAPVLDISMNNGASDFYAAKLNNNGVLDVNNNQPYQKVDHATAALERSDNSPTSLTGEVWSSIEEKNFTFDGSGFSHEPVGLVFDGEQMLRLRGLTVMDRAGNMTTQQKPTNVIYLDVAAPQEDNLEPTVQMAAQVGPIGHGPTGNDLYDQTVQVCATVEDPGENVNSSGLYKVYYKVTVNGEDWTAKAGTASKNGGAVNSGEGSVSYNTRGEKPGTGEDELLTFSDELLFTFDANTFNYNDVKVYVWAEDNSGNQLTEAEARVYSFGIDITDPTIDVRYDNNSAENDKYFKADRTATITVTERNFDPDRTKISTESGQISGWQYVEGTMPNHDDDKWVCTVNYTADGDYTFDISLTDRVGHPAKGVDYGDSVAPTAFTVDKTAPVIEISFDNNNVLNGKYYNQHRTATVRIDEHNFWTEGVNLTTTANIQEGAVGAPAAGAWTSAGDVNTALVPFTADGNYTMHVEFVDLAGNKAEPKNVDEFVVDTTAPRLEVQGVEDRQAYSGDVAPAIVYYDINCDDSTAQIAIRGYKHPEGANLKGVRSEDAFGGSFVCQNIEPVKENDDIYTATGSITDLAGNTTEASVVFSVNRYGSTYMFTDDTQQMLDAYYTNTSPSVHVIEVNVAQLDSSVVTTSLNGQLTTLEAGSQYTVQESKPGWYQYDYQIDAANFEKEGTYDVTLSSQDKAGNTNSNHAIREDNAQTTDLPISFVVDKTAPVNIVTGVENRAQYIAAERTIVVNYDDNIALESLQLYVDNEVVAEYTAEQLKNAGGSLQYVAKAANHWQQFSVVSTDMAGNASEQITVHYLLTGNLLVQYYNNKPLFYGSLAGIAALAALAAFVISRKKKQAQRQPVSSQAT